MSKTIPKGKGNVLVESKNCDAERNVLVKNK